MRRFLIVLALGCGASPPATPARPAVPAVETKPAPVPREEIDVIATLLRPRSEASWLARGAVQLTLGGTNLEPVSEDSAFEVDLLEERGTEIRVGVRLPHVRFAVWTARAHLLPMLAREQHVGEHPRDVFVPHRSSAEVVLRAGARVQRLARKDGWTHIRYIGAVEIDGWVPDDALGVTGPAGRMTRPRWPPGQRLLVIPGTPIRRDASPGARVLAAMHRSHSVTVIKAIDASWYEVLFSDDDVSVRGFLTKRAPPVPIHREPKAPASTFASFSPNATIPAHTCLFVDGEPVGLTVAQTPVVFERAQRAGWFPLQVDTPWGPITFEARGPFESELDSCPDGAP